jgi:GTP-binding protein
MSSKAKIRNIAIVAHIDHGKTTLLDSLLKQSHLFRDNEVIPDRAMDSNDQERERGITIYAKHTGLLFKDYKINIIDTPGHSEFSGEVQRVLGMVSSVLLLVDAQDGPMPQTRFVLSQALKMGLCPIVVINKIDRPHADPDRVLNDTFDLFVELGANHDQLDFKYCYASGLSGFACKEINDERVNMDPLFEMIIEAVPPPPSDESLPLQMQIMTISYNDYVGRQGTGRIQQGKIKKGQQVLRVGSDGSQSTHAVTRVEGYRGLARIELPEASAGDIVSISGVQDVMFGDTLCDTQHPAQLPKIDIDEPTVSINLMINSSPFVGRDGKQVTFNKIKERLFKEKRSNISLRIEESSNQQDAMKVSGRGELHLAVLIETMRREGYELSVSKPQVIIKEIDGVKHEPIERVYIEVPEQYSGSVIEELSKRKGTMVSLHTNEQGITSMEFLVPTRGLMGYRNEFLTVTRGLGILTSLFENFSPWKGDMPKRKNGVLISINQGKTTAYSIFNLQDRGVIFKNPGDEIYEGMIVGENNRDNDMIVNLTKGKQLTNVRASGSDENIILIPPRVFTLEKAIDYIEDDELIEVTPNSINLRKRHLKETDRKRNS